MQDKKEQGKQGSNQPNSACSLKDLVLCMFSFVFAIKLSANFHSVRSRHSLHNRSLLKLTP